MGDNPQREAGLEQRQQAEHPGSVAACHGGNLREIVGFPAELASPPVTATASLWQNSWNVDMLSNLQMRRVGCRCNTIHRGPPYRSWKCSRHGRRCPAGHLLITLVAGPIDFEVPANSIGLEDTAPAFFMFVSVGTRMEPATTQCCSLQIASSPRSFGRRLPWTPSAVGAESPARGQHWGRVPGPTNLA